MSYFFLRFCDQWNTFFFDFATNEILFFRFCDQWDTLFFDLATNGIYIIKNKINSAASRMNINKD